MKILHKELKHGMMKIKVDNAEDLWYLEGIIEPNDLVSGLTERKIKIGGAEERSKVSRITIFLKIRVEKIDADSGLRISGIIIEAPDDIPKGDYHTFNIEEGTIITIEKESWSKYALSKLDEAVDSVKINVLIVAFDREEALFARLKNNGYELLLDLKGDVAQKDMKDMSEKKGNFYQEIAHQVQDYDAKNNYSSIILASPAFWKEYVMKEITDDALKKKITLATCSSIDESVITEILKRPELRTVLEKDRSAKEAELVEELLAGIRTDNAAYGLQQVREKIDSGNISVLLITENMIKRSRAEKTFFELDGLMKSAEKMNAEVRIISSEDPMKKLDGLSGIACLLRWKENYG
jgi:protein pelota